MSWCVQMYKKIIYVYSVIAVWKLDPVSLPINDGYKDHNGTLSARYRFASKRRWF